ncbi:MAG: AI-2E family transporter [Rhizobiales bacterium 65-79]|jgi:predicted PurR-regulated permease PerM|nr:AI-2E family transporter [Hyphomicrobiales bacterium]OJU01596.1 MAG: AI-2E family transporter [Rhizobiales bacterium 65-79]
MSAESQVSAVTTAKTVADIEPEPVAGGVSRAVPRLLAGIFLILAIYALYFAKDFFMPVVLAFLLTLTLTPIVRFFRKRGVPAPVSATLLVVAFGLGVALLGYLVSGPVVTLFDEAPRIGRELQQRLADVRTPLDRILQASKQVDDVSNPVEQPGVQHVVVEQPGVLTRAASNLASVATSAAITLILALFLLASGTLFYEKIVQSFPLLSDKKRALRVVYDVEREISRYLLTISLINCGLGGLVGLGLWVIGMPDPLVWGVAAALLNFLPYVGALTGIVTVGIVSLVSFQSFGYALVAPLFYFACTVLEGQFLTPTILGRRLELNSVSIFIALAFWTWLWGAIGTLIAVPLLVVIKVFCDHFEGLQHLGNFLSAQQQAAEDEE